MKIIEEHFVRDEVGIFKKEYLYSKKIVFETIDKDNVKTLDYIAVPIDSLEFYRYWNKQKKND